MPDEPTARERAEALAIQYAAEECLFAATDAIEAALTAAEQRGSSLTPLPARERAEKLLVDMAFMSTMECHLDMIAEALTAAEQRGREAERERCIETINDTCVDYDGFTPWQRLKLVDAIRALKEPTDAG